MPASGRDAGRRVHGLRPGVHAACAALPARAAAAAAARRLRLQPSRPPSCRAQHPHTVARCAPLVAARSPPLLRRLSQNNTCHRSPPEHIPHATHHCTRPSRDPVTRLPFEFVLVADFSPFAVRAEAFREVGAALLPGTPYHTALPPAIAAALLLCAAGVRLWATPRRAARLESAECRWLQGCWMRG